MKTDNDGDCNSKGGPVLPPIDPITIYEKLGLKSHRSCKRYTIVVTIDQTAKKTPIGCLKRKSGKLKLYTLKPQTKQKHLYKRRK